jgi:radical SAM protein with 4Fe4S-binding SPASM domain
VNSFAKSMGKFFRLTKKDQAVSVLHRLGIDVVHGCQLRCIGCPNSTLRPKISFMSVTDFELIIKNIDVGYIKRLRLFNFGEPLLHPALPDILMRVRDKTNPPVRTVEIFTNAQHHDFLMLAEIFKTGVVDFFAVSCDGDGTKEEYERFRPPGKYEKLIEFLTKAKELRDRYAPNMFLATTNICETEEGRRRWFETLTPLGWTPSFRDWYHFPESIRARAGEDSVVLKKGCHFMRDKYLFVDADGTVIPCCVHPRAFVLGNLKTQKYSEILRSDKRRKKLRELRTAKKKMPVCGDCGY